jgi:alkylated DNA repair dioxygenase AlkB
MGNGRTGIMAEQLTFLPESTAPDSSRPQGLHYHPEFISADDERALIAHIRALPLAPFQFGAFEGKRRVLSFGWRYDFAEHRLREAEALPAWIMPTIGRIEESSALPAGSIRHALFTEYEAGTSIGWHRDKAHFDLVFGLSLASSCKFRFRRKQGTRWERYTLDAEPRSLYLMSGEARRDWEHSIPPVEAPRYSITFRTLAR